MTGIIHFETFLLTGILLNLTPGNDTLFILTRSIEQGKKAGIVSALGIGTGSLIHTILAAYGLSMLISESALLFTLIKYAGAVYLLYIGVTMLTNNSELTASFLPSHSSIVYLKIYRDAIITNVLNPKVALFFISFLPQFIDPTLKGTVLPFFILGMTFITTGIIWCFVLATFASAIFTKLKHSRKASNLINTLCGTVMIGLGVKVALTSK